MKQIFKYGFKNFLFGWKILLILFLLVTSKQTLLAAYIGPSDVITVSPSGNTSTPWNLSENLDIDGTLIIGTGPNDFGVVNLDATFISGINSTASISVSGADSQLNITDAIYLGWNAAGSDTSMTVSDGASVQAKYGQIGVLQGSSGELTITGQGSTFDIQGSSNDFWIGSEGNGSMSILDGGTFHFGNADQSIIVARTEASSSSITINGKNSSLIAENSSLLIGQDGSGSLEISDYGSATVKYLYSAEEPTGRAHITLNNSAEVNILGGTTISISGYSSFSMSNQSVLTSASDIMIALNDSSSADVNITGNGTLLSSDAYVIIAQSGSAVVTVSDNATLKANQVIAMATRDGSSATLNIGANASETAVAPGIIDTNLIAFGNGTSTVNFNHTATDYIFSAQFYEITAGSTNGTINQISGRTTLTADSSGFGGLTNISGGSLVVNGSLGGNLSITTNGTLEGLGSVGNVTNTGFIKPGDNNIGTLTINGDYTSNNGTIAFETVLGDSSSLTDKLIITGNVSGNSFVTVTNRGGLGALTTGNGIEIITINGTSPSDAFTLKSDYKFEGQSAVVGGAYAYSLYHNGVGTDANDGNWYLRSLSTETIPDAPVGPTDPESPTNPNNPTLPTLPQKPVYQPGAPLYEVYPEILLEMNKLGTLQQRVGNRTWLGQNANGLEVADATEGRGFWMKVEGSTSHINPNKSTTKSNYDINMVKTQLGLDFVALENANGTLIGGAYFQYGHAKSDVSSRFGKGDIKVDGYGLGGTLTWYGNNDVYVDGVAQVMWYKSDINSDTLNKRETDGNKGMGYSLSVEVGKKFALQNGWNVTPQAQLSYNSIDFDSFRDAYQAKVSRKDGDALTGRLGVALDRETAWKSEAGDMRRLKAYGIANLYYEFLDGTQVEVTNVKFRNRPDRFWAGIGAGLSHNWMDDKYSIYGEVDARSSLNDFGSSYSLNGTIGFRAKF